MAKGLLFGVLGILLLAVLASLESASGFWTQPVKIVASDASGGNYFGYSVSVNGGVLLIGAGDEFGFAPPGVAYVFTESTLSGWTQAAKVVATDAAADEYFGYSVSISDRVLLIGAYKYGEGGPNSGAAFIFSESAMGEWMQVAKIMATDAAADDYFGYSVFLSAGVVVVGACGDDDGGSASGASYVFTESALGGWMQAAKVKPTVATVDGYFGHSVSLSHGVLVVGAYGGDVDGSVFVFTESGEGAWVQVAKVVAADAAAGDWFGCSVSVSSGVLLVGAARDDDGGFASGAAYIFTGNILGVWTQETKILGADIGADDRFGRTVSVSDRMLLIGAHHDDAGGSNSGAAYVFTEGMSAGWSQASKIMAADAAADDRFGLSVSISDGVLLIGAYGDDDSGFQSGAAYVLNSVCQSSPGYYCPTSYGIAEECGQGNYCPKYNMSTPMECPLSYFCGEDTTTSPTECPAGYYCGATGLSVPTACGEGYFCSDTLMSAPMECPISYYCPNATAFSPTECPAGYYCGVTGLSAPTVCGVGHYCSNTLMAVPMECPISFYCPDATATSPTECPAGYYCGVTNLASPTECGEGYYCSNTSMAAPTPCPVSYYCPDTAATSPLGCPSGFYCDKTGLAAPIECGEGYFCNEILMAAPTECPISYYCPNATGTSPKECPAGYYCDVKGLANATECGRGYYCSNTSMTEPKECPISYYCPNAVSMHPMDCPQGYYCNSNSMADPLPCPVGAFCPDTNVVEPTICDSGYTCFKEGSSHQLLCPAGSYCKNSSSWPITCEIGTYCPAGSMEYILCDGYAFETCPYTNMTAPMNCSTIQIGGPQCYSLGDSLEYCEAVDLDDYLQYTCVCLGLWLEPYCDDRQN
eukprot:CAMPEP_0117828258 /NCGR_PEP_ID=MMETSP0949-20121206/7175_1 /TAXON_ID=44440 /ORGANISM="Chattonella subsalsa, Strain CCMP2191" /LENGTH=869 /DNA_ID=CAMNT_0005668807 /DNA_START=69 /DNA_END=2675 /DNA_ORIENTATION=-